MRKIILLDMVSSVTLGKGSAFEVATTIYMHGGKPRAYFLQVCVDTADEKCRILCVCEKKRDNFFFCVRACVHCMPGCEEYLV